MIRIVGKGKPKSPPREITQVISTIDERADAVEKKIGKLEVELKKCKDQLARMREGHAKESLKQRAIRVLSQKRGYETQLESLRDQSFNLEQTNALVESAKDAQTTVNMMKKGVKSMKKELRKMNVYKLEELRDEMDELMLRHREVEEAMGRSYSVPVIDDEELQAELDALGDELALDDDNSYLDQAMAEIRTPEVAPSAGCEQENAHALVDEFGLPKLPALWQPDVTNVKTKDRL